jgi:quercetin dioxygenase-like cupin family protein
MTHEDDRRILEDWPEAKIITAKKECVLGNHYHKIKTERFVLVKGGAKMIINGIPERMERGILYTILPNQRHTFELTQDSILIGLCSLPHDESDVYKD